MEKDFTSQLQGLRGRIDTLDDKLIALFKERIGIIHEVAALKRIHTPSACHLRPGREGEMHRRIYDAFKDTDFSPAAALAIWRQIIGASTHLESPITVAVSGSERFSALAREYFGRPVGCMGTDGIKASIEAVANGRATIALLPAPNAENLVEWTVLKEHPTLRVFAALPVLLAKDAAPQAYAIAAVACESSGDDVSLLLLDRDSTPPQGIVLAENARHRLIAVAGVSNDAASLGTLPTPLIDSTLTPW